MMRIEQILKPLLGTGFIEGNKLPFIDSHLGIIILGVVLFIATYALVERAILRKNHDSFLLFLAINIVVIPLTIVLTSIAYITILTVIACVVWLFINYTSTMLLTGVGLPLFIIVKYLLWKLYGGGCEEVQRNKRARIQQEIMRNQR